MCPRREALWEIDNYSIKTDPYLHIETGYAPKMKESITSLE